MLIIIIIIFSASFATNIPQVGVPTKHFFTRHARSIVLYPHSLKMMAMPLPMCLYLLHSFNKDLCTFRCDSKTDIRVDGKRTEHPRRDCVWNCCRHRSLTVSAVHTQHILDATRCITHNNYTEVIGILITVYSMHAFLLLLSVLFN